MPVGYSKTPLIKKLGLKPNHTFLLYNAPENYFELLGDLPEGCTLRVKKVAESAHFIHLFVTHFKDLTKSIQPYKKALKKNGLLWVSWPKGSSSIATDINRDSIRDYVLSQGLVDVKVAAIDEDWSGLKFVYRVKDR